MFIKYFKNIYNQYGLINFLLSVISLLFVLIVIDYFNLFTLIYNKLNLPIIICILCFIIIKILSLKPQSLFLLKSVNYIDFYGLVTLVSIMLYKVFLKLYDSTIINLSYKNICSKLIIFIIIVLLLIRYIYITIIEFKNKNKAIKNVFDLKQLYNDEIPDKIEFILIEDEAVNYDLLERNKIINQIKNTIINCNNNSKFVMSLKGPWGSGKTTILNNVKNKLIKENILFIDDFEPWVYNDKNSLLIAFFDTIMRNINCGFRINEINTFTKTYLKTITANTKYSIDNLFDDNININRIKKIINNYLDLNNKKIVLVLDNLERCSSDHILFILKTIHNLFNFKRIIYILSYDENAMKKHFESKLDIDYSYIEKIEQVEFFVPKLDDNILQNVMTQCLNNYFKHSKYVVNEKEQQEIIKALISNIKNLRDLKRIINSSFNASFNNTHNLNNIDMLLIETILLKNPDLWHEINTNNIYYISEDRYVYENKYIYNTERYNTDTTDYFNNLFSTNKHNVNNYKNILCYLFPNIKIYINETKFRKKDKVEFIPEHAIYNNKEKYRSSVLDKRIYNSKYFYLYFNKGENEFIKIDKKILEFIFYINSNKFKTEELYKKYLDMVKIYPGWLEKYTLETFQMHLNSIKKEKLLSLLKIIYFSYYEIDDSILFFVTNAKNRTEIIISDIILMLSDDDYFKFIEEIKKDYQNLYLINDILYWLNPKQRLNEIINNSRYETFNSLYNNMLYEIKNKRINMYSPIYYNRYNMLLLFKDENYMSFIKSKINKDNLMLFILDCLSGVKSSYGIGYSFNIDYLDKFYGWDKLKEDIKQCQNSDLKDFLLKAINTPNPYKDIDQKNIYYVEKWVNLNYLIIKYLNRPSYTI